VNPAVKMALQLLVGAVVAGGLMVAAIALWLRNLLIFGAPLLVASLAAAWVAVDNVFVYPRRRQTAIEGQDVVESLSPPGSAD